MRPLAAAAVVLGLLTSGCSAAGPVSTPSPTWSTPAVASRQWSTSIPIRTAAGNSTARLRLEVNADSSSVVLPGSKGDTVSLPTVNWEWEHRNDADTTARLPALTWAAYLMVVPSDCTSYGGGVPSLMYVDGSDTIMCLLASSTVDPGPVPAGKSARESGVAQSHLALDALIDMGADQARRLNTAEAGFAVWTTADVRSPVLEQVKGYADSPTVLLAQQGLSRSMPVRAHEFCGWRDAEHTKPTPC